MKSKLRDLAVLALLVQAIALISSAPASAASITTVPGELQVNDDSAALLTSEFAAMPPTVTVDVDDLGPVGPQIPVDDVSPLAAVDVSTIIGKQCRRVTVTLEYRLRGRNDVAFYFRLVKDWCWSPNTHKITSWSATSSGHVYAWATPVWQYDGVKESNDFYYQYFSGIPQSGHYSYRAGKFTANCFGVYCGSRNPKIIIRAHGDGTYSYWTKG
jgi:hypothetical protein